MKNILTVLAVAVSLLLSFTGPGNDRKSSSGYTPEFEKTVEIIKKYETLHTARHWPLVGYGHRVLPGEKFARGKTLSEKAADELLRNDLKKLCARYRQYGADSLLLSALAYNCGIGVVGKSGVLKKLRAGDRDIRDLYLAHCRYRGKVLSGLKKRRIEEFEALFRKEATIAPETVITESETSQVL